MSIDVGRDGRCVGGGVIDAESDAGDIVGRKWIADIKDGRDDSRPFCLWGGWCSDRGVAVRTHFRAPTAAQQVVPEQLSRYMELQEKSYLKMEMGLVKWILHQKA